MRISVVVPNLATNCIVRAWPIIKVLQRHHEVEVVGSLFGQDTLFPLYAHELPYKAVRWEKPRRIYDGLHRIAARVTGELVYAFKPVTTSLGAALLLKLYRGLPVILDVEDWETSSLYREGKTWRRALRVTKHLVGEGWGRPNSLKYRYIMERLAPLVDEITVVSTFLQRHFGGNKLAHGADTTVFDPTLYDRNTLRRKWQLDTRAKFILFAGSPSPYKGIEDILAALDVLSGTRHRECLRLLMVGRDIEHSYTKELLLRARGRIEHLGPQPHALMPQLLALSDMVVLPQRSTLVTAAQMPAKVFEAMAMAKPIIASRMSDLPEVLDGCGIVVEPENISQLAAAIEHVLEDESFAIALGTNAREKCIRLYSWDAMDDILTPLIERFARLRCKENHIYHRT